MSERTETCTPEERRLLDLLWQATPMNVDATYNTLRLSLEGWPMGYGSGHETAEAFYAADRSRE